jgi:hypothetical protein
MDKRLHQHLFVADSAEEALEIMSQRRAQT